MAACKLCIEQDGKSASEAPHADLVCYRSAASTDGALQRWRCRACDTAWERFKRLPKAGRDPHRWIRLIG